MTETEIALTIAYDQSVAMQRLLLDLPMELQKASYPDGLWTRIGGFTLNRLPADGCVIVQASGDSSSVLFHRPDLADAGIDLNGELFARLRSGESVLAGELARAEAEALGCAPATSVVGVPIVIRDRVWGGIAGWRESPHESFRAVHAEMLGICAVQAANLIGTTEAIQVRHELQAWRQISGEMASFIQDPVTLLDIWLDKLRRHVRATPDVDEYFDKLKKYVSELDSAAKRFLDLAQVTPQSKEPINLHAFVEQLIHDVFPLHLAGTFVTASVDGASAAVIEANRFTLALALREVLLATRGTSDGVPIHVSTSCGSRTDVVLEIVLAARGVGVHPDHKCAIVAPDHVVATAVPGWHFRLLFASRCLSEQAVTFEEIGAYPDELRFRISFAPAGENHSHALLAG